MSLEEQVRAKHEFQDSFFELLECLTAMTSREIEIAVARIADKLPNIHDETIKQSSLITGQGSRIILSLRNNNALSESKLKRVWFTTTRKSRLKKRVAKHNRSRDIAEFARLEEEAKARRERMSRQYKAQIWAWEREIEKLGLFDRIFNKPMRPQEPSYPVYPMRPFGLAYYESRAAKEMNLSELMIFYVEHHLFPHPEFAPDFVNEVRVKDISIKLLEAK
jgi:hypothetical protein